MNNTNQDEAPLDLGDAQLDTIEQLTEAMQMEENVVRKNQDPLSSLYKHHPECILDYKETVLQKLAVTAVPNQDDLDKNHRSQPFITQYEKTRILGFRTNQLAQGARPLIAVPEYVKSTLEIARMELQQRRLPFIVKRPMPDGSFEYWRLSDLLIL